MRVAFLVIPVWLAVAGLVALLGRPTLAIALLIGLGLFLLMLVAAAFQKRPLRAREPGHSYVYIEPDGMARELTADEGNYVEQRFEFGDGAAPYFKRSYSQRNRRGDRGGYLLRRRVPWGVTIHPAPDSNAY